VLAVSENFGGWGLIARLVDPGETLVTMHEGVEPLWNATGGLTVPESVLYDPDHEVLYVSNYIAGAGYVSKVSLDGEVLAARWVEGIPNATGMGLQRGRLYVAGLTSIFEIDVETGTIAAEHPIEGAVFLNDIVIDSRGTIYISDGQAGSIFSLRRGRSDVWLHDERLTGINGLCLDDDTFLAGAGGGGVLYAIDRDARELHEIVSFGQGPIIDGIAVYDSGRYLVSDWNGITRLISRDGTAVPLLDTRLVNMKQADFCWLAEAGLLLIPTFGSNSVAAYTITIR
jgi:sugar lactone lactonase YvrE